MVENSLSFVGRKEGHARLKHAFRLQEKTQRMLRDRNGLEKKAKTG